jgi:hypothetical protein
MSLKIIHKKDSRLLSLIISIMRRNSLFVAQAKTNLAFLKVLWVTCDMCLPWRSYERKVGWDWFWKYRFFFAKIVVFSLYNAVNGGSSSHWMFNLTTCLDAFKFLYFGASLIQLSLTARIWIFCWFACLPFMSFIPLIRQMGSFISRKNEAPNVATGIQMNTRLESRTFRNTWKEKLQAAPSV